MTTGGALMTAWIKSHRAIVESCSPAVITALYDLVGEFDSTLTARDDEHRHLLEAEANAHARAMLALREKFRGRSRARATDAEGRPKSLAIAAGQDPALAPRRRPRNAEGGGSR